MTIDLDLQVATDFPGLPATEDFEVWARAALAGRGDVSLTIRLVDREESHELNRTYRCKDRPTNVLSFPAGLPPEVGLPLIGDVVICAPLVVEEAAAHSKEPRDHWAHLTIHGILHLLGHDHQREEEAAAMEALEVELLAGLGIADPYR